MHKSLVCVFVAAGMLQGCSTMSEQNSDADTGISYVNASNAERVLTETGDCLQVNTWSSDSMVVECQASAKAPEPTKQIMALSFDGTALFDFDSSELSSAGRGELDGLISKVGKNTDVRTINVVGHADSMGTETYNQSLSEARAESVQPRAECSAVSAGCTE